MPLISASTGPMYVKYNGVLRGIFSTKAGHTMFSTTIHLICSGLKKLSRITEPPPGLLVYRGNGGMALPHEFLELDERGSAGGVECAFMSTSPDRDVAIGYSGVEKDKDLPTLFEIEIGKTSIGADISTLSQFEAEQEFLYAPLTYVQIIGTPCVSSHKGRDLSVCLSLYPLLLLLLSLLLLLLCSSFSSSSSSSSSSFTTDFTTTLKNTKGIICVGWCSVIDC